MNCLPAKVKSHVRALKRGTCCSCNAKHKTYIIVPATPTSINMKHNVKNVCTAMKNAGENEKIIETRKISPANNKIQKNAATRLKTETVHLTWSKETSHFLIPISKGIEHPSAAGKKTQMIHVVWVR